VLEDVVSTPLDNRGPQDGRRVRQGKFSKYDKTALKLDTQELTGRLTTWLLQGNRLEMMLQESKLKDVMIALGIATEKLLLLEGQPTSIISTQQQGKLDDLLPKLAEEMRRRQITLTERTIDIAIPGGTA
jgi:hypothetical protein